MFRAIRSGMQTPIMRLRSVGFFEMTCGTAKRRAAMDRGNVPAPDFVGHRGRNREPNGVNAVTGDWALVLGNRVDQPSRDR